MMIEPLFKSAHTKRRFPLPVFFVVVLIVVGSFFAIRFYGLSLVQNSMSFVVEPASFEGGVVRGAITGTFGLMRTKSALMLENNALRQKIAEREGQELIIKSLLQDIRTLQDGFMYEDRDGAVFGAVLSKPPSSVYDTVLIDVGLEAGVGVGDSVLTSGGIAIGVVERVHDRLSQVRLYSSSGSKTSALILRTNQTIQVEGAGGGMLVSFVPKDFPITVGDSVVLETRRNAPIGVVESVVPQSAGSLQAVLITSAANMHEIGFVLVMPAVEVVFETP